MAEEIQHVLSTIEALKKKFSSSIEQLKWNVSTTQEEASQEVARKLDKRPFQFQKKGNKAQFSFNAAVEEHVEATKKEMLRAMSTATEAQQPIIKKAMTELDKGMKAIATRQKYIRIADHSELGWG